MKARRLGVVLRMIQLRLASVALVSPNHLNSLISMCTVSIPEMHHINQTPKKKDNNHLPCYLT